MPISESIFLRFSQSETVITAGVEILDGVWREIDCVYVRLVGYDIVSGEEKNIPFGKTLNVMRKNQSEKFDNLHGIFHIELDACLSSGEIIKAVRVSENFKLEQKEAPCIKYSCTYKKNYTKIKIRSNCENAWSGKLWLICSGSAQLVYIQAREGTVEREFYCASTDRMELRLAGLEPEIIEMIPVKEEK